MLLVGQSSSQLETLRFHSSKPTRGNTSISSPLSGSSNPGILPFASQESCESMASPAWPGITSTRNCLSLLEKRFYELHSVHKYEYEASKVPVSLADFFNSGDLSPPMGPWCSAARGYEVRNGCARTNRDLVDDFSSCCSFDGEISTCAALEPIHFGLSLVFFVVALFSQHGKSLQVMLQWNLSYPKNPTTNTLRTGWNILEAESHTQGHDVYPGDFHRVLSPGLDFMTANGKRFLVWMVIAEMVQQVVD